MGKVRYYVYIMYVCSIITAVDIAFSFGYMHICWVEHASGDINKFDIQGWAVLVNN